MDNIKDNDVLSTVFAKKNKKASSKDCKNKSKQLEVGDKAPKQRAPRPQTSLVKLETNEGIIDKNIYTNCKPHLFLINGKEKVKLTARQVQDVNDIGFGGLLKMKAFRFPPGIIPFLVAHFDAVNRIQCLPNQPSYNITPDDVFDFFGLPLNPNKQLTTRSKRSENEVDVWLGKLGFNNPNSVTSKEILCLFSKFPEGGDDFKKLFVFYSLSVILAPLPDFKLKKSIYPCIADASTIKKLDWCTYILDNLCIAVERSAKFVNGCVLILLGCYCYRFPHQGIPYPTSLPFIKHLSEDHLKHRFDQERVKGYGRGISYLHGFPITSQYTDWCRNGNEHDEEDTYEVDVDQPVDEPTALGDDPPIQDDGHIKEVQERSFTYCFDDRWPSDIELANKGFNDLEMAEVVFKRDLEVITHSYCQRVVGCNLRVGRRDKELVSGDEILSQTQQIWENNDWLATIDEFCRLLINKNHPSISTSPTNVQPVAPSPPANVYLNPSPSTPINITMRPSIETPIPTALKELCDLDLGKVVPNFLPASEFVTTNMQYLKGMKELELKVLDYSMLKETMTGPEILCTYKKLIFMDRRDAQSMFNQTEIATTVLDCWAMYLNALEKNQALANPSKRVRVYLFGTSHCFWLSNFIHHSNPKTTQDDKKTQVIGGWKTWVNSYSPVDFKKCNMFFIPYQREGHYMLVVVDLINKAICYFDNVDRFDSEHAEFVASGVRDVFTDFADVMGHEEAAECVTFPIRDIKFPWTVNDDSLDCGIYMAYFMEQYQGTLNIDPLHELGDRRLYRASILTRVLLSDLNQDRDKLVTLAHKFADDKPRIMAAIIAQRSTNEVGGNKRKRDLKTAPKKAAPKKATPKKVPPKKQNVPRKKFK